MKIFVIYDHASAPASAHHKLAITLPAKWLELSVDKAASRPGRHSRRASGQAALSLRRAGRRRSRPPSSLRTTKSLRRHRSTETALRSKSPTARAHPAAVRPPDASIAPS